MQEVIRSFITLHQKEAGMVGDVIRWYNLISVALHTYCMSKTVERQNEFNTFGDLQFKSSFATPKGFSWLAVLMVCDVQLQPPFSLCQEKRRKKKKKKVTLGYTHL